MSPFSSDCELVLPAFSILVAGPPCSLASESRKDLGRKATGHSKSARVLEFTGGVVSPIMQLMLSGCFHPFFGKSRMSTARCPDGSSKHSLLLLMCFQNAVLVVVSSTRPKRRLASIENNNGKFLLITLSVSLPHTPLTADGISTVLMNSVLPPTPTAIILLVGISLGFSPYSARRSISRLYSGSPMTQCCAPVSSSARPAATSSPMKLSLRASSCPCGRIIEIPYSPVEKALTSMPSWYVGVLTTKGTVGWDSSSEVTLLVENNFPTKPNSMTGNANDRPSSFGAHWLQYRASTLPFSVQTCST